jgi:hypothetical protein
MKSKEELLKMLYSRLAELQDGRIKEENPEYAKQEAVELGLLYDILGDEVKEEYWEAIETERYFYL